MTFPIDAVQEVASVLYGRGDACDFGIDESRLPEMIDMAFARYPTRKVRAVKQWMWWDFDVSEEARLQYAASGVQPAIIFANYLIWDSSNKWKEGWNVKTTALVTFEENCFFITHRTVYILVGQGNRKTVNPDVANKIHF